MEPIRFLLDEHVPEYLADEIYRLDPAIQVLAMGNAGAPPKRLKDAELLIFMEENELAFITHDMKSMSDHISDHWNAGRHTWGVIMMRQRFKVRAYAEQIVRRWSCLPKDDWRDYVAIIP